MDLLRSCYSVDMEFDDQAQTVVNVTYFFADPNARTFQGPHLYASDNYQWQGILQFGPGERWDSVRPWSNGKKPCFLEGKGGFCGDPDWWQNGTPPDAPPVTYSAFGIPVCCPQPAGVAPWHDVSQGHRTFTVTGEPSPPWSMQLDAPQDFWVGDAFGNWLLIWEANFDCANDVVPEGFQHGRLQHVATGQEADLVLHSYDPLTFTSVWVPPAPHGIVPATLRATLTMPDH